MRDTRPAVVGITGTPRFRLLAPLGARNLALLWSGNAVSLAGDQFQLVALAVLALDLTGSTALLGAVLGVQAVPRAVLMLVGGVVADRSHPRAVMLAANALQGLLVALVVLALATGPWHPGSSSPTRPPPGRRWPRGW
jgi:MFS family permease